MKGFDDFDAKNQIESDTEFTENIEPIGDTKSEEGDQIKSIDDIKSEEEGETTEKIDDVEADEDEAFVEKIDDVESGEDEALVEKIDDIESDEDESSVEKIDDVESGEDESSVEKNDDAESGKDESSVEKNDEVEGDTVVYEGKVNENFDYGDGGGNQYFVKNAYDMKVDGRLKETGRETLSAKESFQPDIRTSEDGTFNIHIDHRPLDEASVSELEEATPENECIEKTNMGEGDIDGEVGELTDDELTYLDESTIDNEGLPEAKNTVEEQKIEDWQHPHSTQEDDGKDYQYEPDSWQNPRKLEEGEQLYQLTPSGKDTKSSFFTDAETINQCRDEKTDEINLDKLFEKLQIKPQAEKYDLVQYEYCPNQELEK